MKLIFRFQKVLSRILCGKSVILFLITGYLYGCGPGFQLTDQIRFQSVPNLTRQNLPLTPSSSPVPTPVSTPLPSGSPIVAGTPTPIATPVVLPCNVPQLLALIAQAPAGATYNGVDPKVIADSLNQLCSAVNSGIPNAVWQPVCEQEFAANPIPNCNCATLGASCR